MAGAGSRARPALAGNGLWEARRLPVALPLNLCVCPPLPACSEDAKRLCLNKTLVGESRDQVGCRN